MTQEDKELLLKDLCARLPYGFTIHRYSDNRDITFEPNELDEFAHFLEYSEGKEFKPYLRPMSSMTEDEERKFISLKCKIVTYTHGYNCILSLDELDWLNSHHFDYRGLIPKELALEAPEGMYKIE